MFGDFIEEDLLGYNILSELRNSSGLFKMLNLKIFLAKFDVIGLTVWLYLLTLRPRDF